MATAPRLEDFLSDAPSVTALRIDQFVQRQPGDGVPESEQTTAYLSHDRRALYIVFVCHDREPENIRANLTKREATLSDDLVGVYLDTFHDRRRAYLFLVNPRGIQRDSIITEGQGEDPSFDTLWDSRGQLTATGYVVWMAIPFRSLRFASGTTEVWGIGLTRRIPRTTEEDLWPFVSRRVEGLVPHFAAVGGFQNLRAGRNVQVIPYATAAAASLLNASRTDYGSVHDARTGADGKLVWRDRITFDLTANPDFSQVETDDPQVTINQRYEVYFPEKRPFFLENAALFQTPETLFFSRRIVSPRWGARLTGKTGAWNVGSLFSQDRVTLNGSHAADAVIGAARVQRDIGRESTVGVLLTSRDAPGNRNLVASIDTRLRLTPHWTFQAQSAASSIARIDQDTTTGSTVVAELDRTDRHLTIVNRYLARSPDFTSELGFIPRTDIRQALQLTTYRWRPTSGKLLAFGPGLTSSVTWDYAGRSLDRTVNPHFGFEFKGGTQVLVSAFMNRETFAGIPFEYRDAQLNVSSSFLKWMEIATFLQLGGRINYAPASGLAPFLGATTDAFARVTLRPTTWVALEQSYIVTRLQAKAASADVPHTGTIFSNQLSRTKVSLQLTRKLSLRTILDYTTITSDRTLTSIQPFRRFNADFLATYLVNPWTAVYVGYTNGLQDLALETTDTIGLHRVQGLARTDRQAFAKVSYVIRF